jgi:hypothetical protein
MKDTITLIFGTITILIAYLVVSTIIVWFLWNNVLVYAIDSVNQISLLQSLGILILFQTLLRPNVNRKKEK